MNAPSLLQVKAAGIEFSYDIVNGVYYSRLIKRFYGEKVYIKVYSPHRYDYDLSKQFCDELIYCSRSELKELAKTNFQARDFWKSSNNPFKKEEFWHPCFNWDHDPVNRQCSSYVCFISVFSERWGLSKRWGKGRTLPFEYWCHLKELVNAHGLKVVLVGSRSDEASGFNRKPDKWDQIADEVCMREDFFDTSEYFNFQLGVMNRARFTVATGGATYLPLTFSLPIIGSDPLIYKEPRSFPKRARFWKEKNVSLFTKTPETHEETYDFIKKAIIQELTS